MRRRSVDLLGQSSQTAFTADLDQALGVWVPGLRVVVIDAGHPVLAGLDDVSYETMLVRAAWHEWGHALSLARAQVTDVASGERYLSLAPDGVREVIRAGGYRVKEYTHEVIAETYALLMLRRRSGGTGQPPWLDDETYELMRRVCGWTE